MYIRNSPIPQHDSRSRSPWNCIFTINTHMTSIRTTWFLILSVATLSLAQTNVLGTVVDGSSAT